MADFEHDLPNPQESAEELAQGSGLNPPPERSITVAQLLHAITPTAWVTPTITAGLVLCFVASLAFGVSPVTPTGKELLDAGANFGPMLVDGQWWRLVTATLLHAGILHLVFNLWALWNAGTFAERIFGNVAFFGIYCLSGVGASLLSIAVNPLVVSVGASGAIFGVYGALFAFSLTHQGVFPPELLRQQRNSLLAFLAYNLFFALSQKNVDLVGHAGGFMTGMLAGVALSRDLLHPGTVVGRRLFGAASIASLLALGGWGVLHRVEAVPEVKAYALGRQALANVERGQFEKAIDLYTQALKLEYSPERLFNRGIAYLQSGRGDSALADLMAAHDLAPSAQTRGALCEASSMFNGKPTNAQLDTAIDYCTDAINADPKEWIYARRGILWLQRGKYAEALSDAMKAVELAPEDLRALGLRAQARLMVGDLEGADADCTRLFASERVLEWEEYACVTAAYQRQEYATAAGRLTRLKKDYSEKVPALLLEAQLLDALGEESEVSAVLDRAVELEPDNSMALNNRAWNRVCRKEFAVAKADADKALTLSRDNPNILGTRCFALVGLGDLAAARRDCTRSVELNREGVVDRGMLAYLEGRGAEAAKLWEQAGAESPSLRRALKPWIARAGRL